MDSEGRNHPFEVLDYFGDQVEIDAEIVPLIKAIWWQDLETLLSCQDQDGRVWVELPGRDAERLLRLLASRDGELRANILRLVPIEVESPEDFDAYQAAHSWECRTMAVSEGGELFLAVSIRFPRDQLAAVVAVLEAKRQRWRRRCRSRSAASPASTTRRYSRSPTASRASSLRLRRISSG